MTSLRCKPGDLAVVVWPETSLLLGRYVIVIRERIPGEIISGFKTPRNNGHAWVIRSAVSGVLIPWVSLDRKIDMVIERSIFDKCLRPIRPQADDADELNQERTVLELAGGLA